MSYATKSTTYDWGTVGANSSAVAAFAVPGAAGGSWIAVGWPQGGVPAGLIPIPWISAPDEVSITLYNITGSGIPSGSLDLMIKVTKEG